MNMSLSKAYSLIGFSLMALNLSLLSCKPAPQSSSKDSGGTYPTCKSNNGTGYGAIFACGSANCAKDNADYTSQCTVDLSQSCAVPTIASDPNGHPLDTSKDIIDVGSGIYYNTCGGAGYGDSWSCGDPSVGAKCAKTQDLSAVCVVSGGSKLTDLSKLKSVPASQTQNSNCANPSRNGSSSSSSDIADISFWDAANEQGNTYVVKVTSSDVGTGMLIPLVNTPLSSSVTLLQSGYTVTVTFSDGSTTAVAGTTLGTVDDYSISYPGKTVGNVRVDPK